MLRCYYEKCRGTIADKGMFCDNCLTAFREERQKLRAQREKEFRKQRIRKLRQQGLNPYLTAGILVGRKAQAISRLPTMETRAGINPGASSPGMPWIIKGPQSLSYRDYPDRRLCMVCRQFQAAADFADNQHKTTCESCARKQACRKAARAERAARRDPNKVLNDMAKRYPGFTRGNWRAMYQRQKGKCALCPKEIPNLPGIECHTDHDHRTGRVRGLLCPRCNQTMKWVDQTDLTAVARFMENPPPQLPRIGHKPKEGSLPWHSYWQRYGFTQAQWQWLRKQQSNRCALCRRQLATRNIERHISPYLCPETARLSALFCPPCKRAVERLENRETLAALRQYATAETAAPEGQTAMPLDCKAERKSRSQTQKEKTSRNARNRAVSARNAMQSQSRAKDAPAAMELPLLEPKPRPP